MATITVKQLLHRVAPGVAIGPANPLEVRQFDGSGQPIAPATETTLAALKTEVDKLKTEVDKLTGLIDSDALKVALTGRTVPHEVLVFADSVAITDTVQKQSEIFDLSRFKQVTYLVRNSLDKDVNINFRTGTAEYSISSLRYWDGETWEHTFDTPTTVPPGGGTWFLLSSKASFLDRPYDSVRIHFWAAEAPTQGALTIIGLGVPN